MVPPVKLLWLDLRSCFLNIVHLAAFAYTMQQCSPNKDITFLGMLSCAEIKWLHHRLRSYCYMNALAFSEEKNKKMKDKLSHGVHLAQTYVKGKSWLILLANKWINQERRRRHRYPKFCPEARLWHKKCWRNQKLAPINIYVERLDTLKRWRR